MRKDSGSIATPHRAVIVEFSSIARLFRMAFEPARDRLVDVLRRWAVQGSSGAQYRRRGFVASGMRRRSRAAGARLLGYWHLARASGVDRLCGGLVGLRIWHPHLLLLPAGPGRAICPRCGLASAAPHALERRPCEPAGRLPQWVLSTLWDGRYAAAVAAAPGRVRVAAACA